MLDKLYNTFLTYGEASMVVLKSLQYNRGKAIHEYGFAIPCIEFAKNITTRSPKGIIEVGAGTGYLSKYLNNYINTYLNNSVNTYAIPTDVHQGSSGYGFNIPDTVKQLEGVAAIKRYRKRDILLSWPPYSKSLAYDILTNKSPKQVLYYIGELDGCTADNKFNSMIHDRIIREVPIPNWPGIYDRLFIIK